MNNRMSSQGALAFALYAMGALALQWRIPELAGPFILAAAAYCVAGMLLAFLLRPDPLLVARAIGANESPATAVLPERRASLGADRNGDLDRQGRGSELRVGRGLVDERRDGERNSTYVFVASDNEALTWQPGSRTEFGGQGSSFALQGDRVEVGDLSAGVTWERNGVQTSLAYVEREQSTRVGNQSFSQDENFAGVTVTMRR